MKTFDIFLHPKKPPKAVKQGFCWPAFFIGPIWAIVNRMTGVALILLILNFIVLRTIVFIYGFSGILLGMIMMIYVGAVGNQLIKNRLLRNGYVFFKTVLSKNRKNALILNAFI